MIVAPRPWFDWKLRTRSVSLGARTLLVGVVNVTPDSFSEKGRYFSRKSAIAHSLRMLDDGADILDIGGESTRPGIRPQVSEREELDRILPVMEEVLRVRPETLISIDTYKAGTARAAIASGAEIVNDVSGFLWDKDMASVCAETQCGVILMHTRGHPDEWRTQPPLERNEALPLVVRELRERSDSALAAGIQRNRIVLDPGFGFGKIGDENYPLLAHFDALHAIGYPLLAGTSRKSFLGKTLETMYGESVSPDKRNNATLASVTATVLAGAHLVRVHDVRGVREAVAIADAIRAHVVERASD